jgi:hypothetical protein
VGPRAGLNAGARRKILCPVGDRTPVVQSPDTELTELPLFLVQLVHNVTAHHRQEVLTSVMHVEGTLSPRLPSRSWFKRKSVRWTLSSLQARRSVGSTELECDI